MTRTDSPAYPVSYRHYCVSLGGPSCTSGNGKPRRSRCKYCGGALYTVSGTWVVIPWTGTGHYRIADAASIHRSETSARRAVDNDKTGTLVVRFLFA